MRNTKNLAAKEAAKYLLSLHRLSGTMDLSKPEVKTLLLNTAGEYPLGKTTEYYDSIWIKHLYDVVMSDDKLTNLIRRKRVQSKFQNFTTDEDLIFRLNAMDNIILAYGELCHFDHMAASLQDYRDTVTRLHHHSIMVGNRYCTSESVRSGLDDLESAHKVRYHDIDGLVCRYRDIQGKLHEQIMDLCRRVYREPEQKTMTDILCRSCEHSALTPYVVLRSHLQPCRAPLSYSFSAEMQRIVSVAQTRSNEYGIGSILELTHQFFEDESKYRGAIGRLNYAIDESD